MLRIFFNSNVAKNIRTFFVNCIKIGLKNKEVFRKRMFVHLPHKSWHKKDLILRFVKR